MTEQLSFVEKMKRRVSEWMARLDKKLEEKARKSPCCGGGKCEGEDKKEKCC